MQDAGWSQPARCRDGRPRNPVGAGAVRPGTPEDPSLAGRRVFVLGVRVGSWGTAPRSRLHRTSGFSTG